ARRCRRRRTRARAGGRRRRGTPRPARCRRPCCRARSRSLRAPPTSVDSTGASVPVVRQLARLPDGSRRPRMIEFIFMLTRDDVTLSDAREVYASTAQSGVRHVGCKDVGLPTDELKALMDDIRANGHETWIEVVSETEEDTLASARAAAQLRPDH